MNNSDQIAHHRSHILDLTGDIAQPLSNIFKDDHSWKDLSLQDPIDAAKKEQEQQHMNDECDRVLFRLMSIRLERYGLIMKTIAVDT
jgi:hypothetical protein